MNFDFETPRADCILNVTSMFCCREQYGKFDAIWDVQSFTALNLDDRIRFV